MASFDVRGVEYWNSITRDFATWLVNDLYSIKLKHRKVAFVLSLDLMRDSNRWPSKYNSGACLLLKPDVPLFDLLIDSFIG